MNKIKIISAFTVLLAFLIGVAIVFKQSSPGKNIGYQVSRTELDTHTLSFVEQLNKVKILPRIREEQTECYEFKNVQKDTFFGALHIQEGDCVISFNDQPFNSPMSAMEFYKMVTTNNGEDATVVLEIDRAGHKVHQELRIRK